jgi:hypothetical protein
MGSLGKLLYVFDELLDLGLGKLENTETCDGMYKSTFALLFIQHRKKEKSKRARRFKHSTLGLKGTLLTSVPDSPLSNNTTPPNM